MSFLKNLFGSSSASKKTDAHALWIAVKCRRCGEIIRARVDLYNDLSIDYGEPGSSPTYICRKVLIGESGRCFQRVEVALTFDAHHSLVSREITGGQFVDE